MPSNAVTIGTVTLPADGFARVTNLPVLWQGADQRGRDRIIPGSAGVVAYQRRSTVTHRTLRLFVFGDKNISGTPHADRAQGLYDNLKHLRDNVADPTGTGDGTRTCTVYLPNGSSLSGPVHVTTFEWEWFSFRVARAILEVSIPAGRLT